jgi:hypothetical protein
LAIRILANKVHHGGTEEKENALTRRLRGGRGRFQARAARKKSGRLNAGL